MTDETIIIDQDIEEISDPICDEPQILEEDVAEETVMPEEEKEELPEESIDSLREQISSLKEKISELEAMKQMQTKIFEEIGDFRDLFPEIELSDIPDSVWESVRKGTPLIASYALYEKRMEAERARIALINASNASRSPGVAGKNTASEYFSPDEVRKMSPAEVHANFIKIRESMKKWM